MLGREEGRKKRLCPELFGEAGEKGLQLREELTLVHLGAERASLKGRQLRFEIGEAAHAGKEEAT